MTTKTIYSGTTHNVGGPEGHARSRDGFLDIRMPEPHPAAENLFGAAWSACFMSAIGFVASQRKIALPEAPSVDTTIDVLLEDGAFVLRAKLDVTLAGVDREVGEQLVEAAHEVCPYSKAVRGNIEVDVKLAEPVLA